MIRRRSLKQWIVMLALIVTLQSTTVAVTAQDVIQVPVATSYLETLDDTVESTDIVIPAGTTSMDVPMKVVAGGKIQLEFEAESLNQEVTITAIDSDGTQLGDVTTLSNTQLQVQEWIEKEEKGTFSLHIETESSVEPITISCQSLLYRTGNRTLVEKQWMAASLTENHTTAYYKINMTKSGYITIHGRTYQNSSGKLTIELCNSKKASLNPKTNSLTLSNEYTVYYALKKGTYYLKVTDTTKPYKLRYKVTTSKDQGGSSKTKATTLTKGTTKTDLLYINDSKSKSGWFQFTLTKSQTLSMLITNYSTRKFEYELIAADSNVTLHNAKFYPSNGTAIFTTSDKLPKGTYYLKVSKQSTKDAGGFLSVKLQ